MLCAAVDIYKYGAGTASHSLHGHMVGLYSWTDRLGKFNALLNVFIFIFLIACWDQREKTANLVVIRA